MKASFSVSAFAVFLSMSTQAFSGTSLRVEMDQSQLLTLNVDPVSVVVGNPSIADITLDGRQVFIHGRAFGETNLVIFDGQGGKVVDFDVTVVHDAPSQLTMFTASSLGTGRQTYTCLPNCEASMMAGDTPLFFSTALAQNRAKFDFATGYRPADVKASSGAPQ